MRLNYHDHYYPSHDVVFSILFGKRELFCALVSAVTGDKVELNGEPHSQATLREDDVLLSTIRFDTFGWALNNKLYTADIQRSYKEARLERRTAFYACRAISVQDVRNMAYEDVNPVNISFILTDHKEKQAVRRIKLCDIETHEIYDDIIEITLVHIPTVIKDADKTSDLYMFARFFAISSQADADKFVEEFVTTQLGKGLIVLYNNATANPQNLSRIESSPYFTGRLTEAQLEEERKKAAAAAKRKALIETARKMLSDGLTLDIIRKYVDLDMDTLNSLTAAN